MDPHAQAFPLSLTEDNIEHTPGLSYRQWMIGQVASGYLANPTTDLEEMKNTGQRMVVIERIIEVADGLIEEEEDNP